MLADIDGYFCALQPDENAPERPPSAYVLFSNSECRRRSCPITPWIMWNRQLDPFFPFCDGKCDWYLWLTLHVRPPEMREDLKGQNLTFTEIAKLVGENWQSLGQVEKEPFETQAQNAKDKYNQDLAEYKKTVDYRNYLEYLQEFKAKHSHHSQGLSQLTLASRLCSNRPVPEKEVTKRVRLTETNGGEHHTNRLSRARRAGSLISDAGGEPPVRRQRIGSTVSNGESQYSASVVSAHQLTPGDEHLVLSPGTGYFDRGMDEQSPGCYVGSPRDGSSQPASGLHTLRREPAYVDAARNEASGPPRHLPSFSDMFDGRPMSNGLNPSSVEAAGPTFGVFPRGHQTASPVPTPSLSGSDSRPPSLRKEQSSAGSISSGSSYSYPRTPIEGPLPIHALLAGGGKPMAPYEAPYNGNPALRGRSMSPDERNNQMQYSNGPERMPSDTSSNGFPMPHINGTPSPHFKFFAGSDRLHIGYYSGATPNANPPSAVSPPRSSFSGPAAETRPVLKQIQRHSGGKRPADMDGISALLQADKIVDRGAH